MSNALIDWNSFEKFYRRLPMDDLNKVVSSVNGRVLTTGHSTLPFGTYHCPMKI